MPLMVALKFRVLFEFPPGCSPQGQNIDLNN
jgi:hypothetical protein